MDHVVLMAPGLGDSDQGHWQSIWEGESANYRRVKQKDWNKPDLDGWVKSLSAQIEAVKAPLFLVAHSLGCALVAHWPARQTPAGLFDSSYMLGALLVSSGDVEVSDQIPPEVTNFIPMPLLPLAFPSIVVASDDDPYVTEERAWFFAKCWGSEFLSAGSQGHITTTSGHGEWPAGRNVLNKFVAAQILQQGRDHWESS